MKTTLSISLLILISLGGLAQKPQKRMSEQSLNPARQMYRDIAGTGETRTPFTLHKTAEDRQERRTGYSSGSRFKATQAMPAEKMDSLVDYEWDPQIPGWSLTYKEWFEFDSLGRNTLDAWLGADGPVFPDYGGKWEAVWDAGDRMIENIEYDWNDSTGFTLSERNQYGYNAMGNQTLYNYSYWDDKAQSWVAAYVDSSFYDGNGNIMKVASYAFDTLAGAWNPSGRSDFLYDSSGILAEKTESWWNVDSNSLQPSYRMEYYPDALGRDSAQIEYWWDGFSWWESWREIRQYDGMDRLISEEYSSFDGEVWYGNDRYEYSYDGSDRLTEEIDYFWDNYWWTWYISGKNTYGYDANGNRTEETESNYDTASAMYTEEYKSVYEYDLSSSWSDIAIPLEIQEDIEDGQGFPINNKVLKITDLSYNPQLLAWDTVYNEDVFYSPFVGAAVDCEADFSWRADTDPLTLIFTDASSADVSSWYWDFGDGTTSTLRNPKHTYAFAGTYKVSLSVTNQAGDCSGTAWKQVKAGITTCTAEFTMDVDTAGRTITLNNLSAGSNPRYYWEFGDGTVSAQMSPVHQYAYDGTYVVTLTVQNDAANCMDRYSLSTRVGTGNCRAEFDVFVDSSSNTAAFRGRHLNPENVYRWEFGDGSVIVGPNATKTFPKPGYYSARLIVSNKANGCVDSRRETVLIGRRSPGGRAGFIYVSGDGNKVQFNDRSLGEDLSYYWNFNDQNSSTERNPMHEYDLPGYYDVCLTVSTADGLSHTYCEKIFAGSNADEECLARFDYLLSEDQLQISCFDRSLGDPDSWKWTYDDGWSTTAQNPSWVTGSPRYVKIQQTIVNSSTGCRDDAFGLVNMGEESGLVAGFGYVVDTTRKKASTYPVDFVGVSLGDAGKLKWSFGDDTYDSTTVNPTHTYAEPGTYTVCLTVINTTTGEEDESCDQITVGATSIRDQISFAGTGLRIYPNPFSERALIEISLPGHSAILLEVFDLMGRKVKVLAEETLQAGTCTYKLEGSDLEAGNYYLVLRTSRGISRKNLLIIR